jgi:hypothetical protein
MTENEFFERLRQDARPLRYQPDEFLSTRIAARVRERMAAPTAAQFLARWFRPLGASMVAVAVAASLTLAWVDQTVPADPQPSIESLAATNTIEISAAGDVYGVNQQ